MNKKTSKWLAFAALLMFAAATFQIVSDHFILGAVFFGSAACFLAAADSYRKKEKQENREEADDR